MLRGKKAGFAEANLKLRDFRSGLHNSAGSPAREPHVVSKPRLTGMIAISQPEQKGIMLHEKDWTAFDQTGRPVFLYFWLFSDYR